MMEEFEIYPLQAEAACQQFGFARSLSQKERDAIDEDDFAGPHKSFPIDTQAHLDAAAKLIGHADDPEAVKRKIIAIAKRKGFKLPESWQEEDEKKDEKKDGSQERILDGELERDWSEYDAAHGHAAHYGSHTHMHSHNGHSHSHAHTHVHESHHNHVHHHRSEDGAIQQSERTQMSLPLVRIDAAKREVWGQATAEVPDSYGTIFGYCPDAWAKWRGNIREQHDAKKAVGRAVEIQPDEKERAVYVGSRVSRGAQDTWLKIEDNVLTGYSASIIPDPEYGPDPKRWPQKEHNGKMYPYLPRYTVAELSLVDNPACPGCDIQIVRADGFVTDVVDTTEEEQPQTLERAGARVSKDTQNAMHKGIGHTLHAAVSQMQNCGCDVCQDAMKKIDPDGDGDIDLGGYDDPDKDAEALYGEATDDMERTISGIVEQTLQSQLSPIFARLQGIAGTLARANAGVFSQDISSYESIVTSAITRALEAGNVATTSSLAEVRADLSAVKEQVDRIAETPLPGMPVMNAGATPRPVEKQLATDPYQRPRSSGSSVYDAISLLNGAGQLDTVEKQVEAVAAALAQQQRG
jgi:hypothetical protein